MQQSFSACHSDMHCSMHMVHMNQAAVQGKLAYPAAYLSFEAIMAA